MSCLTRPATKRSSIFWQRLLKSLSLVLLFSFTHAAQIVEKGIQDQAFPGAALVVMKENKIVYAKAFGKLTYESETEVTLDTLFDLASLTKPLVTAASILKLCDEGSLTLNTPVSRFFPQTNPRIQIHHLLSHTSGLPADIPPWFKEEEFVTLERDEMLKRIWEFIFDNAAHAEPDRGVVYSDLGYILLGKIVEKVSGLSLDLFFEQHFVLPLQLARTTFCPLNKGFPLDEIAPTEVDLFWRNHIVDGKVHDEKAEVFDGVAGHAGLFSTAYDLAKLVTSINQFSLGWSKDLPKVEGAQFSSQAFGHLGFTGTSIWIDPEKKLKIIFLTNRVYPTRDNIQIRQIRRALAQSLLRANDEIKGQFKDSP